MKILVIDVGGTHIKLRATGQKRREELPSGSKMTAKKMVASVRKIVAGWKYDAVTIGYPGVVLHGHIITEPHNLGRGWVKLNFNKAFNCPLKIINDAAMQALGSYHGKRMIFLGLGTGLGSAMIVDGVLEPTELAHLPYKKGRTYEDYVGLAGLQRLGKKKWRRQVNEVVKLLKAALEADSQTAACPKSPFRIPSPASEMKPLMEVRSSASNFFLAAKQPSVTMHFLVAAI